MVVRERFEEELAGLRGSLVELGKFTLDAFTESLDALEHNHEELALKIIEDDTKANQLEEEINHKAILLIARQSPVAGDLRRIISTIKAANELERIADFAVNLAKSSFSLERNHFISQFDYIRKMHALSSVMLELVMEAFDKGDAGMAKQVANMDDQVDELCSQAIFELLSLNQAAPDLVQEVTQLAFICRYIERAADHITNIAENVVFLVKGKRYELNK